MQLTVLSAISLLVASAFAQTISGQFDCLPAGSYTLCQNLWGATAGVGSQSSTLTSSSANTVAWTTNWTWANNQNSVKSYANVESTTAKGIQLANIQTAPTTWTWNYATQSNPIRADVSYDIWTGVQQVGQPASTNSSYEIMIWLSGLGGIQPVGSQIVTGVNVAGHTWNLWKGPNTNWQVLSFVSLTEINDFNVDLKDFFTYIVASQGVASTQYVQSIQAGTEPFTGAANLVTTAYSVSLS
ncbi:glycoside hydrolase family 12 protein [Hymenopellis radicata]|nr:glycoside hydrolase family 12 protein [Hymenopellis radicata]